MEFASLKKMPLTSYIYQFCNSVANKGLTLTMSRDLLKTKNMCGVLMGTQCHI